MSSPGLALRAAFAAFAAVAAVALTPLFAAAAPVAAQGRYALVIGVNEGDPGEERLLYAERDAARVADVLTRLAGVAPEDLLLVRGADAAAVTRAFVALAERVAQASPDERPVLYVYYSGHADAAALHLRGTRLPFTELTSLARSVGAEVSVLVVDACRSGGLTRVKGAIPAEPFEIRAQDRLDAEGLAIITSSAEGEDAQESDRLKGGIFTHHFVSGLIGAADASGDARITLTEAYRYAYAQTLRATTRTRFVQHPTYSFSVKGRQELVLTRLNGDVGLGRIRLAAAGHYLLIERFGAGEVAAELDAEGPVELLLAPGAYLVRRRTDDAVWEGRVEVSAEARVAVTPERLQRLPFRQSVRKGYGASAPSAWSVGAAFELGGPLLPETGVGLFGAVALQLDLEEIALALRLRYGRSESANEVVALTQDSVGLDLGAYKLFDLWDGGVAAGLGLRVGVDFVSQRFETRGRAPSRGLAAGRVAPVVRLEVAPTSAVGLHLDCGADITFLEVAAEGGARRLDTPVVPFCSLGFGVELP